MIKVICQCPQTMRNKPKTVYVIRRADGGFGMPEMFFTKERAMLHVEEQQKFYREFIEKSQPNRTWEREHYLVECKIIEKKILI